jgi:hypothetical protein
MGIGEESSSVNIGASVRETRQRGKHRTEVTEVTEGDGDRAWWRKRFSERRDFRGEKQMLAPSRVVLAAGSPMFTEASCATDPHPLRDLRGPCAMLFRSRGFRPGSPGVHQAV